MDYEYAFANSIEGSQIRGALPCFCKHSPQVRILSYSHLFRSQRRARREGLVLQRLPGQGPAFQGRDCRHAPGAG